MALNIWQKLDYDNEIKIYGEEIECYSPKKMKELYPDKDYKVVGEVRSQNKKEAVERIMIGSKSRKVAEPDTFNKITNKVVGYVAVGQDEYVALLESRLLFILILFGLGAGILLLTLLLVLLLRPDVQELDNAMPEPDQYIERLEETDETAPPLDGGGTVSMIYKLKAELDLSANTISMYFQNPNNSNHDVVLSMYIVSGDQQILIATSGRLPAGTGLYNMEFDSGSAKLKEGQYAALYRVAYYNPETGERALVESDITDLVVTVVE